MILTGRAGLIALICVLPLAISPWPAIAFVVLLAALVAVILVDVALAASTRGLNCSRLGENAARLGQPVDTVLVVENPKGKRRFRGQIRDAWAPSARAEPRTHDVNLAAGQQVRLVTRLRPVRRGDGRAGREEVRSERARRRTDPLLRHLSGLRKRVRQQPARELLLLRRHHGLLLLRCERELQRHRVHEDL